jgi:hypothetical protein
LPDAGADVARNRAVWTIVNAEFTDEDADRAWAAAELTWGLFQVPERDLGVLGSAGLDAIELGFGTAYLSGWLARQGARPVGVDLTPAQLATAACQTKRASPGSNSFGLNGACTGWSGRAAGSSSIPATASGSVCWAPTGSSSKPSTSSTPRRTHTPTSTTASPAPSEPASGRWKTSGSPTSPLDHRVLGCWLQDRARWLGASLQSLAAAPMLLRTRCTSRPRIVTRAPTRCDLSLLLMCSRTAG